MATGDADAEQSPTFCGKCGPQRGIPGSEDKTLTAGFEHTESVYGLVIHCVRCGHISLVWNPTEAERQAYDGPGPAPVQTKDGFESRAELAEYVSAEFDADGVAVVAELRERAAERGWVDEFGAVE